MYSIGDSVTLNCADTSGSTSMVQWLNSAGTVLNSATTTTALTFSTLTDQNHETTYTCRVHSSGTITDLSYTIIILSELVAFYVIDQYICRNLFLKTDLISMYREI